MLQILKEGKALFLISPAQGLLYGGRKMTVEKALEYSSKMSYGVAVYNLLKARFIPYRKATFIKIHELINKLEQEPCVEIHREKEQAYMQGYEDASKKYRQEPIFDKIIAEIEEQEIWLMQAGYNHYNVDIAFDAIKTVVAKGRY